MRKIFTAYCKEINFGNDDNDLTVVQTGQNDGDWYRLYNGDTLLTEGDGIDIENRLKGIMREHGIDYRSIQIEE